MSTTSRADWVDHLRVLVIALVVNMHACVTYSGIGSWYVTEGRALPEGSKILFILWQAHLQAFFMGLLFFLAGYFAHSSVMRRGPAGFARERLFRLGAPALLYMLVIGPVVIAGLNPRHIQFPPFLESYPKYVASGRFLAESGPLWFAIALIIFSLVLAGFCRLASPIRDTTDVPPSGKMIAGYALALGIGSFAVRLVQPIGTSVMNMQLCYFTQYVAAFAVGVVAGRRGWLPALAASVTARRAGWTGLFAGPLTLLTILVLGMKAGAAAFSGGWHWQAFAFALWEQGVGVLLSLGLLALFFGRWNQSSAPLHWLSERSFGVYVLHPPVLVALYLVFRPLGWPPIEMAVLLTVTGLTLSYVIADIARRLPGLRAII
jgi:glucan biosynthesis protein C